MEKDGMTQLLTTKLLVPAARTGLMERPRLEQLLDRSGSHRLTLLAAPAGAGKTSLVGPWVRKQSMPAGWVTLDAEDNDPDRFLAYLTAAIRRIEPDLDWEQHPIPHVLHAAQLETVAVPLLNSVTAFSTPWLLVLDQYHLIQQPEVHALCAYLVEHLPPHGHLILLTRADPPFPLARWRAHGDLLDIRRADLAFTAREVSRIMEELAGVRLADEEIRVLHAHTQGWAAGLRLAAMATSPDVSATGLIDVCRGSQRYIAAFLTDEVLSRLSEPVQKFLLQTAILDDLHADLCQAVTGMSHSREILEQLVRENLFLSPLDDEHRWYRYHPLFLDLLRHRLPQELPAVQIRTLHGRASRWYQKQHLYGQAIDHALKGDDVERAASLLEREASSLLQRGEVLGLLHWLEALPLEQLTASPALTTYLVLASLFSGRPMQDWVHILPPLETDEPLQDAWLPVTHALLAIFQGRFREALTLSEAALAAEPVHDRLVSSLTRWCMGVGRFMQGHSTETMDLFQAMTEDSPVGDHVLLSVLGLCGMAKVHARRGRLPLALDLYQRALDLATFPYGRLYLAGQPLMGMGLLYYEWNQLDAAVDCLREGVDLALQWGTASVIDGLCTLASIHDLQGERQLSEEAIQQARSLAVRFDVTDLDNYRVSYHQTRLWIRQGALESAQRWLLSRRQGREQEPPSPLGRYFHNAEQLLQARVWMARHALDQARRSLAGIIHPIERQSLQLEFDVLDAVILYQEGRRREAFESLRSALDLAARGRYVRTILDLGDGVHTLFQAASNTIEVPYLQLLLDALEITPDAALPLVEPLTERELEVLQLMGRGKSNQQIAEDLVIAVGTVKAHASHVFGKLGVPNRTRAVIRARELGLL